MDPATGMAIKYGAGWLLAQFKKQVIDRWTRRRAEAFFETFVQRLAAAEGAGRPLADVQPMLDEMLRSEAKSEVMFEAYRRVCLSASKELGPRVIAVITARLVAQDRQATPEEERLLMVAETFGDGDLAGFADYMAANALDNHRIELFSADEDSNWNRGRAVIVSPVNLGEHVGNWCLKLAASGLVVQDIGKRTAHYGEDGERHIDEPGTLTTYTWELVFQPEVLDLKGIIEGLSAEGLAEEGRRGGKPWPMGEVLGVGDPEADA